MPSPTKAPRPSNPRMRHSMRVVVGVHSPARSPGPCPRHSTGCPASRDLDLGEEGKWKVGQSATTRDQVWPWADWPYPTWWLNSVRWHETFVRDVFKYLATSYRTSAASGCEQKTVPTQWIDSRSMSRHAGTPDARFLELRIRSTWVGFHVQEVTSLPRNLFEWR
jgi:hypothetical protein